MRKWFFTRLAPVVVLLATLCECNTAHAIRKSSSFVIPTSGSAHALTLTTYLTDAADLHYAAVLSGHAPLDAAEIKSAVDQCFTEVCSADAHTTGGAQQTHAPTDHGIIQASTVAVPKAQKLERVLDGLQANTSYDVYFVAEVPNSNGVYGSVLSVLAASTHPAPPEIASTAMHAVNGSTTTVAVNVTLTAPGVVHIAFVPSNQDEPIAMTADDVTSRNDHGKVVVFAQEKPLGWETLTLQTVVERLSPATEYNVVVVTEAPGNGGVYSELQAFASAVKTHASAPNVIKLACSPKDASSSEMDLSFGLQFAADDLRRASSETLSLYAYKLHYTVTAMESAAAASAPMGTPANQEGSQDIVRRSFLLERFASVQDFLLAGGDTVHTHTIPALQADTAYEISMHVETIASHGVVGRSLDVSSCRTHAQAPAIVTAHAHAMNSTVDTLEVHVELERAGNVHYLMAPQSLLNSKRHIFKDATSLDQLTQMLVPGHERGGEQPSKKTVRTGVIPATELGLNASSSSLSSSVVATFTIAGLVDHSPYSIVLIPETIGSRGVFGKPFDQLVDAVTNENASDVTLLSAHASFGTRNSVEIQLSMSKPTDILYACVTSESTDTTEDESESDCMEIPHSELQPISQSPASNFSYTIGNLTEHTAYSVSLFAESSLRNGVRTMATPVRTVQTHRRAPAISSLTARAVDARVDAITIRVEMNEPGEFHYVITVVDDHVLGDGDEEVPAAKNGSALLLILPAESIVDQTQIPTLTNSYGVDQHQQQHNQQQEHHRDAHKRHHRDLRPDNRHQQHARQTDAVPPAQTTKKELQIIKRGHASVGSSGTLDLLVEGLTSNTTYAIHVVSESFPTFQSTETPPLQTSSGVYGEPTRVDAATHEDAPVIVKSTASAASNRTDSIVLTVNVSRPGLVHYQITDVDFADPLIIGGRSGSAVDPHVLRGSFAIHFADMGIEIKNGTNDTQPMDPMVFATNLTVDGLREATTYHVSLTTETFESGGVFGEFPAPLLVTTHTRPPQFVRETLHVEPVAGASTSLSIQFRLDQLGEVHYALFFRGLVLDRTTAIYEAVEDERRRLEQEEADALALIRAANSSWNASDETPFQPAPRWPPVTSSYDLTELTPHLLKLAPFDELGDGVWDNGTISVSRDDVFKRKVAEKTFDKLPPNAIFDVCLVPETADSDGIFAPLGCHRVVTHADYTNQSVMFDQVDVSPVDGTTDSLHIKLQISKLLDADEATTEEGADPRERLERATGRLPYFALLDGHDGRPDFSAHALSSPLSSSSSPRHGKNLSPFKMAVPGRGNVAAAGVLTNVTHENETFITVEHTVHGLHNNRQYFFFFAYETAHSDGVFTTINPHKHRPKQEETTGNSRRHSDPTTHTIDATTHERAPQLKRYAAVPTYGNMSRVTVTMDVACASCEQAIVHVMVVNDGCAAPSTTVLLPSNGEIVTAQQTTELDDPCALPLMYRRVDVNMTQQGHHHQHRYRQSNGDARIKTNIEEDLVDTDGTLLLPNTTYQVFLATETFNSSGVISGTFKATRVTTFPLAPRFKQLRVHPRKGSTTEMLLTFELEYPGEVHYMVGKAGNPELNVTSPYNISAKSLPGDRDSKFHDYGRDVVRTHRSIKADRAGDLYAEVIDYLVAGTPYDVYVVAETSDNAGIYGEVWEFREVSTFATPPMLLAHTAYPTPGTVNSLNVGFRVEDGAFCVVHISLITSTLWAMTTRVADGSDLFGNRLAMNDRFIARTSVVIDENSGKGPDGDGWRLVNVSVPLAGTNYTVSLVTESNDSDGVWGMVATHYNVQSHREPPQLLNVSIRPADARVDALVVDATFSHQEGAHLHYAVLRHGQRFQRSAITTIGQIDVNGSSSSSFLIEGLQGRTAYDVYMRLETFESGGVIGDWVAFPFTATTHGLPAEVLESLACDVSPSCSTLGRHTCSHVANICGECLDGHDGVDGSSNEACHLKAPAAAPTPPTIKINGVRINPEQRRHYAPKEASPTEDEQANAPSETEQPEPEKENDDTATVVDADDASACPMNARLVGPGQCECESGYHVDELGTACVLAHGQPLEYHPQSQGIGFHYGSHQI